MKLATKFGTKKRIFLLLISLGFSVAVSSAEPDKDPELFYSEWSISVGAFRPQIDTYIRVDGALGVLGTELSFDTLGLDKTEVLPSLGLAWQINPRHSVWSYYFDVSRSGLTNTAVTIRVGDTEFPVNSNINAVFNAKVFALGYGYAFLNDADKFFGFQVGLNLQDISFGVEGENGILAEKADATAPLPTFGFAGGYRLSEHWYVSGNAGYFGAKVDNYDGSITQYGASLDYAVGEHVMVGLGYQNLKVDVESSDSQWLGKFIYEYRGPSINFRYNF